MPLNKNIKKVLVIGSGPIVIGQAAEFDYAGTQACESLREEGIQVVLVNSNPATIMTDKEMADRVYMEPLTLDFMKRILRKERPDAILPSLGGQTGLNMAMSLDNDGILKEMGIAILGTDMTAIKKAEDRDEFRSLMNEIGEPVPPSTIAESVEEAVAFATELGYPVIVRPAFTLGGTGGGICRDEAELKVVVENGLSLSPVHQCLVELSIAGWKEIEFEVMRDGNDTAIAVCSMENIDPVGIHTGDSMVVAPCLTLADRELQMLRTASLKIIRALKIEGGCNVQLALDPDSFRYYIIEVNPRVSRSSALASKATGYPIAKIASKIALGLHLHEIINPVTKKTYASFEPALDYVAVKLPRFAFDKFRSANRRLGTQMKATGEVMALGRSLEEGLLKAARSLEVKTHHIEMAEINELSDEHLDEVILRGEDRRLFALYEKLRRGASVEELHDMTKINLFFLHKIENIYKMEEELKSGKNRLQKEENFNIDLYRRAKVMGFADAYLAKILDIDEAFLESMRLKHHLTPVYKMVDTCASEFASETPYFYSTYGQENESKVSERPKVIVLGSGPIRIGQGVEFDYATVHSVWALKKRGYEAIIINNNPETVSTDFSISDKLYFEPLTTEDVMNIIRLEKPQGVVVQFGGQTAINLAQSLTDRGVKILGSSMDSIDLAEDRDRFEAVLKDLAIPMPKGDMAQDVEGALAIAHEIGYPVLLRPSYVLGGANMEIIYKDEELEAYMVRSRVINGDQPVLIDKYLIGIEAEVDAITDGETVVIPGFMQHIERAGVHSGDSMAVYPPYTLSPKVIETMTDYTIRIGRGLKFIGLFNIQFVIDHSGEVFVLEVNPRSSRTVPFLSKVTEVPMGDLATAAILGERLQDLGYQTGLIPAKKDFAVKMPVFSFSKLRKVDIALGPEMKSTGEVIGRDQNLDKALFKALCAAGFELPEFGHVLFTISNRDKEEALELAKRFAAIGYGLVATAGTRDYLEENGIPCELVHKISEAEKGTTVLDVIRKRKVQFVVNTFTESRKERISDGFLIRRESVENNIPCLTSLDTTRALVRVLESINFSVTAY